MRKRKALGWVGVAAAVLAVALVSVSPAGAEAVPSFKIEMLQRIRGSEQALPGQGYTQSPLTAKLGETVEYEAIITNTDNVPMTFGFNDPDCEQIAFYPESDPVQPGNVVVRTCSHMLTQVGLWTNEASAPGGDLSGRGGGGEMVSNRVSVDVPAEPSASVDTLQTINGQGGGYTGWPLVATVGQTLDYQVVAKNTGNVSLTLSGFSDAGCDFGSFAGPTGRVFLPVDETVTYGCSHVLVPGDAPSFSNAALVTWEPPSGPPVTATSTVLADVSSGAASSARLCSSPLRSLVLHGLGGRRRNRFDVWVRSAGIEQLTFALDGHTLETLKASLARRGEFAVVIHPRRLRAGAHRVSAIAIPGGAGCSRISGSGAFVDAR